LKRGKKGSVPNHRKMNCIRRHFGKIGQFVSFFFSWSTKNSACTHKKTRKRIQWTLKVLYVRVHVDVAHSFADRLRSWIPFWGIPPFSFSFWAVLFGWLAPPSPLRLRYSSF
jgi:hypothetical protein